MPAVPHLQRAFGLCIDSTLPVPGAQILQYGVAAGPEASSTADLVIREGAATIGHISRASGPYLLTAESLIFTTPGVARYHCSLDGTTITVEPFAGVARQELSLMLIATALPAVLWLRGQIVLHAAAAILPGQPRAVAFAGDSGSGKSSLLKYLLERGGRVVGDDALCLRFVEEKLEASGLPGCILLRSDGNLYQARTAVPVPDNHQLSRAELGAIVIISRSAADDHLPLTRLDGPDALAALLNHRHRGVIPSVLGNDRSVLQGLARIARCIPVYSIHSNRQGSMRTCEGFKQLCSILEQP